MKRALLVALLCAACTSERRPPPTAAEKDVEAARAIAFAVAQAVEKGDSEALKRYLSFADLARATRPEGVDQVLPATESAFADDAAARLLDPNGAARRLLTGVEIGTARVQGNETVVEGKAPAGPVRFIVALRDGKSQVVRIE